jgi:hypothetical protein
MTFWLSAPSQAALLEFPVEVPWKLVLMPNAKISGETYKNRFQLMSVTNNIVQAFDRP